MYLTLPNLTVFDINSMTVIGPATRSKSIIIVRIARARPRRDSIIIEPRRYIENISLPRVGVALQRLQQCILRDIQRC